MKKMEQGVTEICYRDGSKCSLTLDIVHNNRHVNYTTPIFEHEFLDAFRKVAWKQISELICEEIDNNRLDLKTEYK